MRVWGQLSWQGLFQKVRLAFSRSETLRPIQLPAAPAHWPPFPHVPSSGFRVSASLLTEQILIFTWELLSLGVPPEALNTLGTWSS